MQTYLTARQQKQYIQNEYLIVTDNGEMAYPMFVQRIVKRYLAAYSSVEKKSPHVLRHTYATHLLNNGAEINAVKDLLGHSSLAATQVYTHNTTEKLKKIFNQAHPKA
jgi:integrase/recombinase XerC